MIEKMENCNRHIPTTLVQRITPGHLLSKKVLENCGLGTLADENIA